MLIISRAPNAHVHITHLIVSFFFFYYQSEICNWPWLLSNCLGYGFYLDEAVVESDSDNGDDHADLVEHLGANLSSAHPPTRRRKSSVYSKISVHNEDAGNGQISITEYTKGEQETKASISDFEPITVLGQGAYGTVKLVKNRHTSKLYAQKELKKASLVINENTLNARWKSGIF